jgi:hypothetical protein
LLIDRLDISILLGLGMSILGFLGLHSFFALNSVNLLLDLLTLLLELSFLGMSLGSPVPSVLLISYLLLFLDEFLLQTPLLCRGSFLVGFSELLKLQFSLSF